MSAANRFLIYGANGYTGALIARAARERGHAPILAGRGDGVLALARELGLEARCFALDDPRRTAASLRGAHAVLDCAGPFKHTARALAGACMERGVHYLDIAGDLHVLEALRDAGRGASSLVLPGVGFDVVPTDCLAVHLAHRLPSANQLNLAFSGVAHASPGSARSTVERLGKPGWVRRGGVLTPVPIAANQRMVDFGDGAVVAVSIPWGDLSTAHHSTGIPDIEVFMAASKRTRHALTLSRWLAPLLRSKPVQRFLQSRVARRAAGPSDAQRAAGRTLFWGEARDQAGRRAVSLLNAPEVYTLTVASSLAALERVLSGDVRPGFHTPASLFGPNFVLGIAGVSRADL